MECPRGSQEEDVVAPDPLSVKPLLAPSTVLKQRWKIVDKIGQGAFGEIYRGVDVRTQDLVAIKVERVNSKKQVLKLEVAVLKKLQGCKHMCRFIYCNRYNNVNYVVMELLGENLSDLRRKQSKGCFSVSTTARLCVQLVRAIEAVHDIGYLHRDIKSSNFAMGRTQLNCHRIYLIDFGLARRYLLADGSVRPARDATGFRGTARYASINSHLGKELGRRDDLLSLFYVLVEFLKGALPWRRMKNKDQIGEMKQKIRSQDLCATLPLEFLAFVGHLESMGYADRPDYDLLCSLMQKMCRRLHLSLEEPYDWERRLLTDHSETATFELNSSTLAGAPPRPSGEGDLQTRELLVPGMRIASPRGGRPGLEDVEPRSPRGPPSASDKASMNLSVSRAMPSRAVPQPSPATVTSVSGFPAQRPEPDRTPRASVLSTHGMASCMTSETASIQSRRPMPRAWRPSLPSSALRASARAATNDSRGRVELDDVLLDDLAGPAADASCPNSPAEVHLTVPASPPPSPPPILRQEHPPIDVAAARAVPPAAAAAAVIAGRSGSPARTPRSAGSVELRHTGSDAALATLPPPSPINSLPAVEMQAMFAAATMQPVQAGVADDPQPWSRAPDSGPIDGGGSGHAIPHQHPGGASVAPSDAPAGLEPAPHGGSCCCVVM